MELFWAWVLFPDFLFVVAAEGLDREWVRLTRITRIIVGKRTYGVPWPICLDPFRVKLTRTIPTNWMEEQNRRNLPKTSYQSEQSH